MHDSRQACVHHKDKPGFAPCKGKPGKGRRGRRADSLCRMQVFFLRKSSCHLPPVRIRMTPSSFMRRPARGTYNKTIQAAPKRQPAQGTFSPDSSLHRLSPAGEKRPPGCTPNAGQGTGERILREPVPGKGPKRPSCGQVFGRLHPTTPSDFAQTRKTPLSRGVSIAKGRGSTAKGEMEDTCVHRPLDRWTWA